MANATKGSGKNKNEYLVKWMPIDEIIPYDNNPRMCPPEAVSKVAKSIEVYGWRQAIVVDDENVIIAGHTRRKAAEALGLKTVPVHVADGMTPEEVMAYRIADIDTLQSDQVDRAVGQELSADIATLQAQLTKSAPSKSILEEATASMKRVVEGAAGGALAIPTMAAFQVLFSAVGLG